MTDVFVFLGSYANEDEAQADYDVVKELHRAGRLSSYDAALLTRDAFGRAREALGEFQARLA
jgi:hypothetical protein